MAARRTPIIPEAYVPTSYDVHREQVGKDVAARLRSERLTGVEASKRFGGLRPELWHDVLRGDTGDHGLGRVLQAAAACGLRYTLVRSGSLQ